MALSKRVLSSRNPGENNNVGRGNNGRMEVKEVVNNKPPNEKLKCDPWCRLVRYTHKRTIGKTHAVAYT